ncbi:uncharacterized protein C15orf61 isoform X2 [Venturia canescens]|uniref:uncharacterized protein C15orf61 isoform X2 n=1 Tax=Venturia canescens TaxID=32260 RepID=UPI001C9D33D5|nr:uncharacterized protein C15orf61 isoform X2 [Venturia canescens]
MTNGLAIFLRATQLTFGRIDGLYGVRRFATKGKPLASEVLTRYLLQSKEPPWTSYFVKYVDVVNDQRGMSHFNWPAGTSNYHILRTGCFPYIKYHCTKRPKEDLSLDDKFYKAIKIINLGIPTLMYGLAATQLIRHEEMVTTSQGRIPARGRIEIPEANHGRRTTLTTRF